MNRRAFLKAAAGITSACSCFPLSTTAAAEPDAANSDLLQEAKARIRKFRMGQTAVVVQNPQGQPVQGVRVKLEQASHQFRFGCNLFMLDRCGNPDLEEAYRAHFSNLLNYSTLGFYWAAYEAEKNNPNYAYTDRVLGWTKKRGIVCKGHPLVWDHPAGSPRWLPSDFGEIQRLSNSRVEAIVSRFKDRIDLWDVVNEATHLPDNVNKTKMADFGRSIHPVAYVAEPLKIARTANPNARLLVNDYRTDPPYLKLLSELRTEAGFPFDAVGIQSHMHDSPWPLKKIWGICDTYGALGLPIHFTETTIVSGPRKGPGENWGETDSAMEDQQAIATEQFYIALFAHPAVQAITWWDFSDRGAWQRAPAGLVRKDMSPKPAYDRLLALIRKEWWTNAEAVTDAKGEATIPAFYGTHTVTGEFPSGATITRKAVIGSGQQNRVELKA